MVTKLVNALGVVYEVAYTSYENLLDLLRENGAQGLVAEEVRPGIVLPYAMEASFDWRLIGAKKSGEGVWWRGHYWKRRALAANPAKNMKALIRYSRGKGSDGGQVALGDQEYVVLVDFIGDGPADARFTLSASAQRPALAAVGARPTAPRPASDDDLLAEL